MSDRICPNCHGIAVQAVRLGRLVYICRSCGEELEA